VNPPALPPFSRATVVQTTSEINGVVTRLISQMKIAPR
jgi:hypothetical protein